MASESRWVVRSPAGCCWPNCPRGLDDPSLDLPLCTVHAHQVSERWCEVTEIRAAIPHGPVGRKQRNEAARKVGGYVYYLRLGDRIKIGHTTNLRQRMAAYPPDARLLAVEPGGRGDEAALHQLFQSYCVGGREWYGGKHRPILDRIAKVRTQHGPPESFIPPRRRVRPPSSQAVMVRARNGGRPVGR